MPNLNLAKKRCGKLRELAVSAVSRSTQTASLRAGEGEPPEPQDARAGGRLAGGRRANASGGPSGCMAGSSTPAPLTFSSALKTAPSVSTPTGRLSPP